LGLGEKHFEKWKEEPVVDIFQRKSNGSLFLFLRRSSEDGPKEAGDHDRTFIEAVSVVSKDVARLARRSMTILRKSHFLAPKWDGGGVFSLLHSSSCCTLLLSRRVVSTTTKKRNHQMAPNSAIIDASAIKIGTNPPDLKANDISSSLFGVAFSVGFNVFCMGAIVGLIGAIVIVGIVDGAMEGRSDR
jgi:hypothetical protein